MQYSQTAKEQYNKLKENQMSNEIRARGYLLEFLDALQCQSRHFDRVLRYFKCVKILSSTKSYS